MPELAPEGRRAGAIELSIEPEGCRGRGAMALMPSGVARRTSSGEADSQEGRRERRKPAPDGAPPLAAGMISVSSSVQRQKIGFG